VSENFQNDHIELTVNRKPDCVVEMTIIANPEFGKKNYQKAIKNISKEVSFPGFRKGRAPDDMVKSKYGSQIDREFKEIFLNESVRHALDLCSLYPWNRSEKIKAEIDEASTDKGGKFTVTFECFPEIPEVTPADITIDKVESNEVGDEDIEKHIRGLRYHHAEWNEVTDRPAEENDRVELTVKEVDGENPKDRKSEIQLSKDDLDDWLFDLIIGKKVGDSTETTPPEQEGDPKKVEITVDKILAADLKELTDEFVTNFGAETVDDFKTKVKEYLDRQEQERVENLIFQAIQQKLLEQYPFDVPASLMKQEKETVLRGMLERLKQSGYSDAAIQAQKDELEQSANNQALLNLRNHYILLKVAEDQKFQTSREEMMNELIKSSIQADGTLNMEMVNNPDQYAEPVMRQLQLLKAMEYLAKNVTIQ